MQNPAIKTMKYTELVSSINRGALADELAEELQEVIKAVRQTRKTGKLTLSLTFKLNSERSEDQIKILPEVKATIPKLPPEADLAFSTADGSLTKDDPRQQQLPLREPVLGDKVRELREV